MDMQDQIMWSFGMKCIDNENWTEAVKSFQSVKNPDANVHYGLAQAYTELGQIMRATEHIAIAARMGHPEASSLLDKLRGIR